MVRDWTEEWIIAAFDKEKSLKLIFWKGALKKAQVQQAVMAAGKLSSFSNIDVFKRKIDLVIDLKKKNWIKESIIYFFDGRSPSKHKLTFFI